MVGTEDQAVDWEDATAYAPLLAADRSIIAWEWLRRDPGYRKAALAALGGAGPRTDSSGPEAWGLLAFEAPDLAAPEARPVWSAVDYPYVLNAEAISSIMVAEPFDIERLRGISTIVHARNGREHLLLSDGLRAIRVDIVSGRVTAGRVQLRYRLAGFGSAAKPLLVLRRLLALVERGRFSQILHPRQPKARRWVLALRVHDALRAGASQREIAAGLLSDAAGEARWRVHAPSLRSQVQRLVRTARAFTDGGYRTLLS